MGKITIVRLRKRLIARMIPFYCIIGYDLGNFEKYLEQGNYALSKNIMDNLTFGSKWQKPFKNMPKAFNVDDFKAHLSVSGSAEMVQIIPIKNGEMKTIEILNNSKVYIFIASFGSSGTTVSNQVYIEQNSIKQNFLIEIKSDWKTGHMLSIRES